MKDFLVKKSKQLEQIRFSQIAVLVNILFENPAPEEEFIRKKYSRYSHNYNNTRNFMIDIGLIKIHENTVLPLIKLGNTDFLDTREEAAFKKYVISRIMTTSSSQYGEAIRKFLGKFKQKDAYFIFEPKLKQRLELSGIRNFLIDFGVIRFNEENNNYMIEKDFESLCLQESKAKITLKTFLMHRSEQEALGKNAELEILKFEKKRLSKFPSLLKEIKRISDTDVFAGYDILSFEEKKEEGKFLNRFIEVKAVSEKNFYFYWSKNEIDIASIRKDRYYLYLLPVVDKNIFNLKKILIIKNPYKEIFMKNPVWIKNIELYSFQKCAGPQPSILL